MHITEFAASRTRVTLASERTILASGGLLIYGIVVSNTDSTAHAVQFRDADDTVLLDIEVAAGASFESEVKWLADNGLKVREPDGDDAAVLVTVFHNSLAGTA